MLVRFLSLERIRLVCNSLARSLCPAITDPVRPLSFALKRCIDMKRFAIRLSVIALFLNAGTAFACPLAEAALPAPAREASELQASGEPTTQSALAASVAGVGITVRDLDTSLEFYQQVLGCKLMSQREEFGNEIEHLTGVFGARTRTAVLHLGEESIELTDYLAPEGKPVPQDARSNDQWFQHVAIVVSDMDKAYGVLRKHNVQHASSGPQTLPDWNPNAGGIKAFYFKDPDGHPLEVIWFPEGKGDPKWKTIAQYKPDAIFLGIDHTAIVVRDTNASLALYRDVLGMKIAGTSDNYGIEQERLNNVFGAHLRITGLRAASGIGVEFLEYLTPAGGSSTPGDVASNDLIHNHTIITTPSVDALSKSFVVLSGATGAQTTRQSWVSASAVDPDGAMEQPLQRMGMDLDGHAILFREQADSAPALSTQTKQE